ncbi:MAG: IS110 family transposase, partial [Vicinamibacteria bacterium]|nr:IS110 family transposase [Vicinamibacteria bacterium]
MLALTRQRVRLGLLLIAFNAAAHFIPFERSSLSPDDYAALVRMRSMPSLGLADMLRVYPDRPLTSLAAMAQHRAFGQGTTGPLLVLFALSAAVIVAVFILLSLLLDADRSAFVGALIFSLLPNKLEIYHGSVQTMVNFAILYYLLSLALFVQYARRRSRACLAASLLFYSLGVFAYEIGFLAPLFAALYGWLRDRKALHATARALAFGSLRPFMSLFHQYAGGYMALALLNGLRCFAALPWHWLGVALLCDAAILIVRMASAGGRRRLGSISKAGNKYARAMLVQAGWCILRMDA